jgi:geranylgeranyl pyrophosphate synthase
MSAHQFLAASQARIQPWLENFLDRQNPLSASLSSAMRHAVLNGGKRVRPTLAYGAALACGGTLDAADAAAGAVELVHCYSLVHDDLPCMDDDDLRRGVPTCHKVYGEATALLAGDTLQTLAFVALAEGRVPAAALVRQIGRLAAASADMAVGQALDLAAEGRRLSLPELETVHRHKTGALIRASVFLGAMTADCRDDALLAALEIYADRLGLAFQVHDDVLDVVGDTRKLGKKAGADAEHDKATYPALLGLDAARALAGRLHDEAVSAVAPWGDRALELRQLADFLVARDH